MTHNTQDSEFDSLFDRLPAELKEMVFHHSFEATNKDINISLADDGVTLLCPALDTLTWLQQSGSTLHKQAKASLFESSFCFNFICESFPHYFIFKAFCEHAEVDPQNCRKIKHVKLSRFTVRGLIRPDVPYNGITSEHDCGYVGIYKIGDFPQYLPPFFDSRWDTSFCSECKALEPHEQCFQHWKSCASRNAQHKIHLGLQWSAVNATRMFFGLEKLGISLDIVDCLPETAGRSFHEDGRGALLSESIRVGLAHCSGTEEPEHSTLIKNLIMLQTTKLRDVDLHFYWDDFVRRDRTYDVELSQEHQEILQDFYMRSLSPHLQARSITSHVAEDMRLF